MTVAYTPTQSAQVLINTVNTGTTSNILVSSFPAAALYRWDFSPGLALLSPVTLSVTVGSLTPGSIFKILLTTDTDVTSTLVDGALPASLIPSAYIVAPTGTATSYELASTTPTAAGTITFDLDLSSLARYMAMALNYTHPWNGSLLLWLVTANGSGNFTDLTMTAYSAIDYHNRDTGRQGFENARGRIGRCPVTGFASPVDEWTRDGYRGIMVSKQAYDPPEPPPRIWPPDSPEPEE